MAYKKRTTSEAYDKLSYRLEAMKTINPNFDLGNNLTVTELDELANTLRSTLNSYNTTLMDADDQRTTIMELERQAMDVAERLLATTLAKFGRDSVEYRRVGGTKKSQIAPTGSRPLTFEGQTENGSTTEGSTT